MKRGMSLIELVVAAATAVLLLGSVVSLMGLGRASFREAMADQDRLRAAYFGPEELGSAAFSTPDSLRFEENAIAFLTAYDDAGTFHTDARGRPLWQAYQVYRVEGERLLTHRAPPEADPFTERPARLVAEGVRGLQGRRDDERLVINLELAGGGRRSLTVEVRN